MSKDSLKKLILHSVFLGTFALIIFLPLFFKISSSPKDTFYPWIHGLLEDYYHYLSVIRQGQIQFEGIDSYTTEPTKPSRIHLFYLVVGRISKLININNISAYHASLVFSLAIFYVYTYLLTNLLIPKKFRLLALFIIFFASPFPQKEISLFSHKIFIGTAWWTRMDIANRLALVPHHLFSTAMFVATIYYLLLSFHQKKIRVLLLCLFCLTLSMIFFVIPGSVLFTSLLLMTGLFFLKELMAKITGINILPGKISNSHQKFYSISFLLIIIVSLLLFVFVLNQLSAKGFPWSEILEWESQIHKKEQFPAVFSVYLASFGLLPFFAIFSLPTIFKKGRFDQILIFFLAIMPLILYQLAQRGILSINKLRFVYSAPYVFAGILSTIGIIHIYNSIQSIIIKRITMLIILVLFFSNTIVGLYDYWWPELFKKGFYTNIYIPKKYLTAVNYLDKNTPPFSSVLSTFYVGMYIPAFSLNKVYIGHEVGTYKFWEKSKTVDTFFKGEMMVEVAKNFLSNNKIKYVFWDQGEMVKEYESFLLPLFRIEDITIYKYSSN